MKPFLESLADHIIETSGKGMAQLCFVFPNRRSGLFFKKYLSSKTMQTTWAPEITAINDFICALSPLELADPVDALFELYDVYEKSVPNPDPFDEFYHWGEMMISDFDDIDKYLVEADQIFRNISDLKEVDELFGELEDEQVNFIRQFWANFHQGEITGEKKGFITLWNMLPGLYHKLKSQLENKGLGYEGMLYRNLADHFPDESLERLSYKKVVFVGFNALNACEKKIFKHLENSGKADFYWDYDNKYVNEDYWEAGKFIRQNMDEFKPYARLEAFDNLDKPKDIRIFDLPNDVLQAKNVTALLREKEWGNFDDHTDTAVVLCDEELLVPVLMSLPELVKDVNITMGYPFKNSTAYSFVDQLLTLQKNLHLQEQPGFYYKDVMGIMNHPFMKSIQSPDDTQLVDTVVKKNLIYIDKETLNGKLEKTIFRKLEGVGDFHAYFMDIAEIILSGLDDSQEDFQLTLDREYLFQFMISMNRINRLLEERKELDVIMFLRIIKKVIHQLRIPFAGEPLAGLQVMGILETRLLDFKNLVLLSMNEEIMPRKQGGMSFIPYTLRAGYNMPIREDKDAIYAYYFYRLIQRAEHIDLLYNSNSEGVKSGEMSRYLHQLKFENNLTPIRPVMDIKSFETEAIVILKNQAVQDKLAEFYNNEPKPYLSPSALNALIDCSLRYYLRYIAGIGEPKEVNEVVDASEFGTILHDSMKILYEEIMDPDTRMVQTEALRSLKKSKRPEEVLKETFSTVFFKGKRSAELLGRNIIIFRVMLKYILKIMEKDIEISPFKIESLEDFYKADIMISTQLGEKAVKIGGKIDRIDRLDGQLRVIDYKTGSANLSISSIDALFDNELRERNKAGFQTMLYAWLAGHVFKDEAVMPGLYVTKQMFSEAFNPGFTIGLKRDKRDITSFGEFEETYLSNLEHVLEDLFSEEIPFTQTENIESCKYCDFRKICRRTQFD